MAPKQLGFPRSSRLTKRKELQQVLQNGKRVRSRLLELRGLASLSHGGARIGIIVPKHHQSAVDRNRLKRRLRELVRLHFLQSLTGVEIIIRALPPAYRASLLELQEDLGEALPAMVRKLC